MWQEKDGKLYRKFEFTDFMEAFGFLTQVAQLAEIANHHPTIHNEWNVVELWLTTHSAGGVITEKDRQLAEKINGLLEEKA